MRPGSLSRNNTTDALDDADVTISATQRDDATRTVGQLSRDREAVREVLDMLGLLGTPEPPTRVLERRGRR